MAMAYFSKEPKGYLLTIFLTLVLGALWMAIRITEHRKPNPPSPVIMELINKSLPGDTLIIKLITKDSVITRIYSK